MTRLPNWCDQSESYSENSNRVSRENGIRGVNLASIFQNRNNTRILGEQRDFQGDTTSFFILDYQIYSAHIRQLKRNQRIDLIWRDQQHRRCDIAKPHSCFGAGQLRRRRTVD